MKQTINIADKVTLDSATSSMEEAISLARKYTLALGIVEPGLPPEGVRYGIKIDKNNSNPNTRMTYTYDAVGMEPAKMNYSSGVFDYGDWENVWFIKKNKPVMLKNDGTEDYELNPNDYSKKADGSSSDYNNINYAGNVMARIPLVYVSMTQDSAYEYITVSNIKYDDTYKAIAHTKSDGTVVDNIYLACFKGNVSSSKARSISGRIDKDAYTISQWTDYATANGSGWNIGTWGQRMLINSLLWIIGKSDDTQTTFGRGNASSYSDSTSTGGGNSSYYYMIPTGNLYNKGQFFGYSDNYHQVKIFHIEGWWGDRYNFIHGIMSANGAVKVSLIGPYNYTGSGYTTVSGPIIGSYGYGSTTMTNEYGRFTTAVGGSESTYTCDYQYYYSNSDTRFAGVGGYCSRGAYCRASCVNVAQSASHSYWSIGASLSFV